MWSAWGGGTTQACSVGGPVPATLHCSLPRPLCPTPTCAEPRDLTCSPHGAGGALSFLAPC